MARALRLAARGLFTTQPNPRVGCVIASAGEIVGEGWHRQAGGPHAEAFALREAGDRARGATAYVTLEPCSHFGRTPPCADALIAAGVARVVTASEDPNPKIAGAGLERLRSVGIAVGAGLMRDATRELNRGFFSRFERGRPWVRMKLAMSVDGRTALASGESKWITGEASRADVQRWRARSSAILTGAGTARADDPRLTVRNDPLSPGRLCSGERGRGEGDEAQIGRSLRLEQSPLTSATRSACGRLSRSQTDGGEGFQPLRVVLDTRLDALAPTANLLDGAAPTLVVHAPGAKSADDRHARAELVEAPLAAGTQRLDLDAVLCMLATRGINELQVEAGPTLCGALLERGLADELLLYIAPTLLGDSARPLLRLPGLTTMDARGDWRVLDRRMLGPDQRLLLRPPAL
ncbi:MAG: bifunctional diaminohydroxyphosphoribosylaminopyrimidine deaminase/5-amino-6-(5-phosphoribosylamino)uracil reductase RibD [Rhodanobacteraceae bacterium]